jgi:hypothetical protein
MRSPRNERKPSRANPNTNETDILLDREMRRNVLTGYSVVDFFAAKTAACAV